MDPLVERIVAAVRRLQVELPGQLLRTPRSSDHGPAFEFGRAAGLVEGVDRAVEALEGALRSADEDNEG